VCLWSSCAGKRTRGSEAVGSTAGCPTLRGFRRVGIRPLRPHLGFPYARTLVLTVPTLAKSARMGQPWLGRYERKGWASPLTNPFQYTGREVDPETGSYYYRARYYDPNLGRFFNEDPIGFGGDGTNFYIYVYNNPVIFIDPWGFAHCIGGVSCNFTPPMWDAINCFDRCTHRDSTITSGRRPGGGQHGRGQACDLNRANNPGLSRDDAARCTLECFSRGYGQEEHNGPRSSDPDGTHFHLQLNTVPGGHPGFGNGIRPYQPSPRH